MSKTLVFDMDGTIADLYGVDNWLDYLQNENPLPYLIAKPIYQIEDLNLLIGVLKGLGWHIVVTSWLAKDSSKEYDEKVRKAKIAWLKAINFDYDEIHLVKYGTTKANCTRKRGGVQILIDDNEKVRKGWTLGYTIDAKNNILKALTDLIMADLEE